MPETQNPPATLEKAISLFNETDYWECHEVLEADWLLAEGQEKHFLAGIILLAAALHKARKMDSPRGGRRNYAKALTHLAVIENIYASINIRELESKVHAALQDSSFNPQITRVTVKDNHG